MPLILAQRSHRRSCDVVVDGVARSVASSSVRGDRLELCGDIDRTTVDFVREGLVRALHDRSITVIDLTGIEVFGTDAIRLFDDLGLQNRYDVVGPSHIARILQAAGCEHLLTTVSTTEAETTPVVYDLIGRRPMSA